MDATDKLLIAIDKKRVALAAKQGSVEPVPYSEIARELGVHKSMFSRLKNGSMPGPETLALLNKWLDSEDCDTCLEVNHEGMEVITEKDIEEFEESKESPTEAPEPTKVNTVFAVGKLSDSDDEETQKAVNRVRELLAEGAVGVSVYLDLHPEDSKIVAEAEVDEETGKLKLPEGFIARQRIRHTAIVDTPAYADARLAEREDGSLEGNIVFEGIYTGDGRVVELDSIDLESSNLPSPIIWDRHDGDHTGMTVGYITEWVKKEFKEETSARTVLDDEAISASFAPMELPASYFAKTTPTKPEPMRISKPDAKGYRKIYGLAAPSGVCIRNSMQCWTWPGDKDKQHRNFHTGSLLQLDNGESIRVGALTIGGAHLESALARQGVSAKDASNYRDNANRVFALVRVWESRFGLMMAGAIPPDVTEGDIARALACSPSIEFWPDNGARTLVGLHLVPTPGLPVLASAGSAEHYVTDITIQLESEEDEEDDAPSESEGEALNSAQATELMEEIKELHQKMDSVAEVVNSILTLIPLEDVEIPE